jgi:hypothetical protein
VFVQDTAAVAGTVTPLHGQDLVTLLITPQQSMLYMYRWSNIARSHKPKKQFLCNS